MKNNLRFLIGLIFLGLLACSQSDNSQSQGSRLEFAVSFSKDVYAEPLTGRVYVMLAKNDQREPRFQVRRRGIPFWGQNVSAMNPGEAGIIDADSFGFPLQSIRDIPAGEYYVQGFINVYTEFKRADGHTVWLHQDQWEGQNWLRSPGNMYSDVKKIYIDPSQKQTVAITCNHVIPPVEVDPDTKWVKRIKIQSKLLSDFWGHPAAQRIPRKS